MSDITDVLQQRRAAKLAAAQKPQLTPEEARQFGIEDAPTPDPAPPKEQPQEPRAKRESYLPNVMRPLPQSMDAEKGVLGSILLVPKKMYEVEATIGASHFHQPSHATIFQALKELHGDNEPIDLISLTNYLEGQNKLDDVGGPAAVTELFTFVPTASNLSYYLGILCEKYKARQALLLFTQAAAAASEPGGADMIDSLLQSTSDRLRTIQDIGQANAGIEVHSFDSLANFDTKEDSDSVLGYRYLCRGGSCLIVGQSGIGKSSIATQKAIRWAQGQDIFGLGPTRGRKLKSLFIQAENDAGDLAEMIQGVLRSYPLPPGVSREAFIAEMRDHLVFARDTIHTGADFARCAARLINKHKPDLVWVDPLLSYAGDDISSQKVASHFLRNTLNPIAFDTGIIWMLLHHTGKPSTDPKAKAHWTDHDFSYAAFGSSELVNWARAVMVLRSIGEGRFELRFSKRGKRTGVKEYQDPDHVHTQPAPFTDVVYIQHAKDAIYWEQIEKPAKEELNSSKKGFVEKVPDSEIDERLAELDNVGRNQKQMFECIRGNLTKTISYQTFSRLFKAKLTGKYENKNGLYYRVIP